MTTPDSAQREALSNCPFCGNAPKWKKCFAPTSDNDHSGNISCECGVLMAWAVDYEVASTRWNARAASSEDRLAIAAKNTRALSPVANAGLVEALRNHAIGLVYSSLKPSVYQCRVCGDEWGITEHEHHQPGCLCALTSVAPKVDGWLPISEAPVCSVTDEYLLGSFPKGFMAVGNPDFFDKEEFTTANGEYHAPTHFQPLPTPPAEAV